jgi:arsenate reductase-like glutaredoxin family protein
MPTSPDKDRLMGTEEAMASGIMELIKTSDEKVRTLSDLDDEEIGVLSLLETMATQLDLSSIKMFVERFCQFRVSRYRLGRREIGGVISFAGMGAEEGRKKKSLKNLFSGMR